MILWADTPKKARNVTHRDMIRDTVSNVGSFPAPTLGELLHTTL
jgi:hypothetical protein